MENLCCTVGSEIGQYMERDNSNWIISDYIRRQTYSDDICL